MMDGLNKWQVHVFFLIYLDVFFSRNSTLIKIRRYLKVLWNVDVNRAHSHVHSGSFCLKNNYCGISIVFHYIRFSHPQSLHTDDLLFLNYLSQKEIDVKTVIISF